MKRVVVLGALGMAGHMIASYLKSLNKYEVFGVARSSGSLVDNVISVLDEVELFDYLQKLKPDVVVNCIGILVNQSNQNVLNAISTNSIFPHILSKFGRSLGFKIVHLSTDCVFSGRDGGYKEDSPKDGHDNYAKTKSLGELINNTDLTIRTSIIGPELKDGSGLLNWFLRQVSEIKGFTRAYWTGVTTLELAKVIDEMIKQDITGLYHLCPQKKISKYDLLVCFQKIWNKRITIIPFEGYTIDKSLICTRKDFEYELKGYNQMLMELKQWMDKNKDTYHQQSKTV